jgi:DNA-binding response OmpR family regulator
MTAQLPSGHFPEVALIGPRFRAAGDLTLDLFHHDGRVDAEWLGLSSREFALLWRLAAAPGERLTGAQLHSEAWRIAFDAEGEGIAVHMARVRAKLAAAGLAQLVRSDAEGCHFIDLPPGSDLAPFAAA